jgi:glycosyltransferase involved in cell wall biosynthesis
MKINIIDPALSEQTGHHFDWCLKIAEYLKNSGDHDVWIYTRKNITESAKTVLEKYGKIMPVFIENPYATKDKTDPLTGALSLYFDNTMLLASTLQSIDQNAAWLWPTLFEYQLNALAVAKIRCPVSACLHVAPEYKADFGLAMWRDAALRAHKLKVNIQFGVTFKELVPLFTPILNNKISVLPLLVDTNPAAAQKPVLKRIGFFGDQSTRKGIHLLPELIQRLCKLGFEVIVHDSKGKIDGTPSSKLKILGFVDDISEEISKCDLVVLPYDPVVYKHMASAIGWEAVARGVPVVAPANTAPGNFINSTKAGVTFESYNVDSILAAVARAESEYQAIASGAFEASKNWSAHHGTDKFVDAMMLPFTSV